MPGIATTGGFPAPLVGGRGRRCATTLLALFALAVAPALPARDLLVSSRFSDNVLRYNESGAFVGVFASGNGLDNPNGIAFGPDGNLYVGLGDIGRVMVFDGRTGAYLRDLVTPATPGGLTGCRAIAFTASGDLLVDSGASSQVLRYDGASGAFEGVFAGGNGLNGPVGLTIAANGDVYVGAALGNAVHVYDRDGAPLRTLSSPAGQSNATGVLFDSSGRLLVAQSVSNTVQRVDPLTGAGSTFASGGGLNIPIAMIFHPDGDLLVGSFGNDKVIRYDGTTGALVGDFIPTGLGGLDGTHNFAFVPGPGSRIGAGHSGSWFDPATSGQGVILEVVPELGTFIAYWFTHGAVRDGDDLDGHRWFVGQGSYAGDTAEVPVFLVRGGRFDALPLPSTRSVGSARFVFHDCGEATLDYAIRENAIRGIGDPDAAPDFRGRIELRRLTPPTLCLALAADAPADHAPRHR